MIVKLIKLCLSAGLLITSLLSADTIKKGDTVIVKKGSMLCFDKEPTLALNAFVRIDGSIAMMQTDVTIDGKEKVADQFPNVGAISAEYCVIFSKDYSYKFHKYAENGKYVLLDSPDYWVATYSDSLILDESTMTEEDIINASVKADEYYENE